MMENQLKFIASVFKMAMKELYNVMGPESIQTIFRLMGESEGERIERVMRKKYKVNKWDAKDYIDKLIKDVIVPTLDRENVEYKIENDEIVIKLGKCPFRRAGMNITNRLYCTYTEGMIETAIRKALGDIDFKTEALKADGSPQCIFKIKVK
ncbi:MAG: methanogen output domain 1-containing protein, partial [Candidatus Helarchaeota archaeon]